MNARDLLRLRGSHEAARLHHASRRRGVSLAAHIAHEMKDLDAKQTMLQGIMSSCNKSRSTGKFATIKLMLSALRHRILACDNVP
jgi:hypothetical protein